MKVLVFDEWLPWPLDCGKKIRTYNLIKKLSKSHDIIFLAYVDMRNEQHKIDEISKICYKIIPVQDNRKIKSSLLYYIDVIANMFTNEPFSTHYHVTDYYKNILYNTINNNKPDIVHCEWTNLAPLLSGVSKVPTVISAHNVESDIWERLHLYGSNFVIRYIGHQQAIRIKKLEKDWYPKADICIAVSNQDKEVIENYGAMVAVVENGVDVSYYQDTQCTETDNNSIAFTASFDTLSNQDAVNYFMNEIYPLIKLQNKNIKVYFIGKDPPRALIKYSITDRNIIFTGTLHDIRPVLSKVAISIVPLRIGGGSRLKILESMAMKKPIVSTFIGAEGIDVTHNVNILLSDSPITFADHVISLINDANKRRRLAASGYDYVVSKYNWDVLAQKQNNVWTSLLSLSQ